MNTSTQMMKYFIAIFIIFLFNSTTILAGNFTWNGGTSTAWGTSTNWTPNGVPSTNDTVTIVTGSNNVYLTTTTTVKVMTMISGTLDLQSYTLTVTSTCNFNSGAINNGKLTAYGTAVLTFKGTQFGAKVTATGNSILLNGSVFSDSLFVIKKGSSNDNGKGGNTFNGVVQLVDSGTGSIVLADSFPDTFNSTLSIRNTSTGTVYIAHRATGTQFNGDVTFSGSNVYSNYYGTATYSGNIILDRETGNMFFGTSTGSCTQVHGKKIIISSKGISSGRIGLRNFTSLDSSSTINLTVTGNASIYFWDGSTFHDTIIASAPQVVLNGAKFRNVTNFTTTTGGRASNGGCYFAKAMTFVSNSATSALIALATTNADTFALSSYFENTKGTLTINKGLFFGKTTIKNNSTTGEGFFIASTGSCTFKDTLYIYKFGSLGVRFGNSGGTTLLDSNSAFITEPGAEGIAFMQNLTKLSVSTLTLEESPSELTLTSGNSFNGNFYFHGKSIASTGTTFNSAATLKMHATTNVTFGGGNTFNGTTIIQDSSSAAHNTYLANSTADDYNADVTFIQKGTSVNLYPAYTKNSTFSGNITTGGSSSMQMGGNGGKVILDGTTAQSINRGTTSLFPTIKKLQVNKASNSLTLNTPLIVSDSLQLTKGRINTDTTNLLSISHGGKLIGGSDSTYINGPLKKTGNAAFTFAVGSSSLAHPYHPIEITAPTSSTDAYTAHYFPTGQTIGTAIDSTIDNLNACQYWNLIRNSGTSKVKVKLSWNNDSCETISPTNFRVTGWNGSMWEDLGNAATSGDSIVGTVQSADSLNSISSLTLAFLKCSAFRKSITNVSVRCKGGNDGSIIATARGGTSGYSFLWSNGAESKSYISNLKSGTYGLQINDIRGCNLIESISVLEPDSLSLIVSGSESTCGDSTGAISLTAIGGAGTYKYIWSVENSDTSHELINIPAGKYSVLLMDSNGCSKFSEIFIQDSNGPGMNIISQINPVCMGSDTGSIVVEGADSNDPFVYQWQKYPDQSSGSLNFLRPGSYPVQIINSYGCVTYDTVVITLPDTFEVSLEVIGTPCGSSDGQISAIVLGGTLPLTYAWSMSADTDSVVIDLPPGKDTLVVTDANGCKIQKIAEVISTSGFSVVGEVISHAICTPEIGGKAKVTTSGGVQPYNYSWFPYGGEVDSAINLIADDYLITVEDSNGCIAKTSISISGPEILEVYVQSVLPSDDSTSDGKAYAFVSGGVVPYQYLWSNGSTIDSITNLSPGVDSLIVTDNNGCQRRGISQIIPRGTPCQTCDFWGSANSYCGSFPSATCSAPCTTLVSKNIVTDFHADGTDNISDECQFEEAVSYFMSLPDETPKQLVIPPGTYIIGRQDNTPQWYLVGHAVLCFEGIKNMSISGKVVGGVKPILKFEDCMKYGIFDYPNIPENRLLPDPDPITIEGYITSGSNILDVASTPVPLPYYYSIGGTGIQSGTTILSVNPSYTQIVLSQQAFVTQQPPDSPIQFEIYCGYNVNDATKKAFPGIMIYFSHCNNIKIENLELNGNLDQTQIGGGTEDGMQIFNDGIYINATNNILIDNVDAHHFGRDGLVLYYNYCANSPSGPIHTPPLMNCVIKNSKFNFNARNGMTWGGGKGLNVFNSEFNWSGQGRLTSQPGAGIDIEYEQSNVGCYDGTFVNCDFKYNRFYGVTCNAQNKTDPSKSWDLFARNFTFDDCDFVGSQTGTCVYPNSRGFNFIHSRFYGQLHNAYLSYLTISNPLNIDNLRFTDCTFNEEYADPIMGRFSFANQLEDITIRYNPLNPQAPGSCPVDPCSTTCPTHNYLIDFSTSARINFTDCDVFTHYMLKPINVSAGVVVPQPTYNEFRNTRFINTGLNGMYCDGDRGEALTSFNFSKFYGVLETYSPDGLANYGFPYWCGCGDTYDGRYVYDFNTACILNTTRVHVQIPVDNVLFPNFINPIHPNRVDQLEFHPCQSYPVDPECIPPLRKRNDTIDMASKDINEISIYPNPTHNTINIKNANLGDLVILQNSTGKILSSAIITSPDFELNMANFSAGIYFLSLNKKNYYKILKF